MLYQLSYFPIRGNGRQYIISTRPAQGGIFKKLKDTPKRTRLSHTTFGTKKPARNSVEHMQRNNAKSQAVTGEPYRAGSAPMTPAATTPQPAGRSIAKSQRRGAGISRGRGKRLEEYGDSLINFRGGCARESRALRTGQACTSRALALLYHRNMWGPQSPTAKMRADGSP